MLFELKIVNNKLVIDLNQGCQNHCETIHLMSRNKAAEEVWLDLTVGAGDKLTDPECLPVSMKIIG